MLHTARFLVVQQSARVVEMIRASLLLDAQEAAGDAVEEDAEIIRLVDFALGAARLAVGHQSGGGLEVLEAHGALHTGDAVIFIDVSPLLSGVGKGLSVAALVMFIKTKHILTTYSQTKGQ